MWLKSFDYQSGDIFTQLIGVLWNTDLQAGICFCGESFGGVIFCSDKWTITANHCNVTAHANNLALLLTVLCPWLCVHMYQCTWPWQYRPYMTSPKLFWKLRQNHTTYLSLDALWPKHKKVAAASEAAGTLPVTLNLSGDQPGSDKCAEWNFFESCVEADRPTYLTLDASLPKHKNDRLIYFTRMLFEVIP